MIRFQKRKRAGGLPFSRKNSVKISGLMMDPVTNMPIVVLKDVQGQAILPIWVGVYEANAIALEIEKVQTPRPMTIDSRPSDALALALRVDCPIFVDENVLKNSKISNAISERSTNEQLKNWLEGLSDEDLGRYKM